MWADQFVRIFLYILPPRANKQLALKDPSTQNELFQQVVLARIDAMAEALNGKENLVFLSSLRLSESRGNTLLYIEYYDSPYCLEQWILNHQTDTQIQSKSTYQKLITPKDWVFFLCIIKASERERYKLMKTQCPASLGRK